jgi:hypothetical protein
VRLYPSPALEEILEHNAKYKVALDNYEGFLRYMEEVLDLPFDKDDPSIQAFLCLYTLDFKEILENTQSPGTVERLMRFGLKLDILFDKDLLAECKKTSESCLRLYNVIISYKYYQGLLNDLAIFSRFNYFYLPRSISSTGRVFTIPYFMNLQNFKLTKAFIIMHKVSDINVKNYDSVMGAILSVIKTEELRNKLKEYSFDDYTLKTKELMRKYILDFLQNKTQHDNYPKDKTYREQIDWLKSHIKKPKESFYARLLYNSFYNDTGISLIYELDATSSGLQIIGMSMRMDDVCLLVM